VFFDGLRALLDGFHAAVGRPEVPFLQEGFGQRRRLLPKFLKGQTNPVGFDGFEV